MNELNVHFDARAAADVRAAITWYDAERDGLGDEFLSAMNQVVGNVARIHECIHWSPTTFVAR